MAIETLRWAGSGLDIIDQRLLPLGEERILLTTVEDVAHAIETLAVRGAPAIGVTAAYGIVIAAMETCEETYVLASIERLRKTRPTAVNLFNTLDRMREEVRDAFASGNPIEKLLMCARAIHDEDRRICEKLSRYGADLLSDGDTVLTHCNAGALATSGVGTALGMIYAAQEQGKRISVFVDETRPLLQGARLTAWELMKHGIEVTLICDNMAAKVMGEGKVSSVIVGADRIVANGDTANKIGTYGLAIIAREHDVPFYVAAPLTSFDFSLPSGEHIVIEERDPKEVHTLSGNRLAPEGVVCYNPAFDITPAKNISAIISEKGIARPPLKEILRSWYHP